MTVDSMAAAAWEAAGVRASRADSVGDVVEVRTEISHTGAKPEVGSYWEPRPLYTGGGGCGENGGGPPAELCGLSYSTRVPKIAKRGFWVPPSPELATLLGVKNSSEGDAAYLATFSHRHDGL